MNTTLDYDNHLVDLHKNWTLQPKAYEDEVVATLKKIMFSQIREYHKKFGRLPIEDPNEYESLTLIIFADLWESWTTRLKKESSNKEIFCYLRSRAYWKLRMEARSLKTKSVQEKSYLQSVEIQETYHQDFPFITTPVQEEIAKYILDLKYPRALTPRDIGILSKNLNLPRKEIQTALTSIANNIEV